MKPLLTISMLLILISQAALSQSKISKKIRITIKCTSTKQINIRLLSSNMVTHEPVVMAEGRLDANAGNVILDSDLNTPIFASLEIDGKRNEIYLSPGFDLTVNLDAKLEYKILTFEGPGFPENNYLSRVSYISNYIKDGNGEWLFRLEPKDFLLRVDSLQSALTAFHAAYSDSLRNELSNGAKALLKKRNDLDVLYTKLFYSYILVNNNYNEELQALKNGYFYQPNEIPKPLLDAVSEIELDTAILNRALPFYSMVLEMLLQRSIYQPNINVKTWALEKDHFPVRTAVIIRNAHYKKPFDEYLLARNISYWIMRHSLLDPVDSILNEFRNEFPNSAYLPILEREYNKFTIVSADTKKPTFRDPDAARLDKMIGQNAPNISGLSIEGKLISLADFKGKVIYIDIWATWCGPCREEVPYAKKLKEEFDRNNQPVVFFNVSKDQNINAWKKLLSSAKTLYGGENLIVQNEQLSQLNNSYLVTYIPRYILIDKSGKIVNPNAPRPSSGMIASEILKLLK